MRRVGKDFSGRVTSLFPIMMVQAQEEMGEGSDNPTDPHHTPTIIQPLTSQPQKKSKSRRAKRKDTEVPQHSVPTSVADEAVNEEMDDSLERAATTTISLDAEQDRGNIIKTQSKATPNEPVSQDTSLGGGPRCQEAMGDAAAQTRFERVSKISNDPLLTGVNTPQSGEDSLKLTDLMKLCTNLQQRVLDLETTKTTQALEIDNLKRRVKKLEMRKRSRTYGLKRLYKVGLSARVKSSADEGLGKENASKQKRIADIDANKDIYLVNVHTDKDIFGVNDDDVIVEDAEMLFDVPDDLRGEEVLVSQEVPLNAAAATTTTTIIDDITLAQAVAELKSSKPKAATIITTTSLRPKAKGIIIHDQEQAPTPTVSLQQSSQVNDKGKGKMVEQEPMSKYSKKDQLMLDEELAFKLHVEEQEEERIEKLNKLKKLQAKEQDALSDAEKAKLFMKFLEKKRKFFAAKRAKEKRNRPPTKAQQRSIMSTYLKNMDGWKIRSLKKKSFAKIQELFNKAMKRVNTFVDFRTELVEESSKKAKAEITQEDDGGEVTIDATPLSSKSPIIIDYKIYQDGKKSYFQIFRADGNSQIYLTFSKMLKFFDREDLEVLRRLVKDRFKNSMPLNHMDSFLLHNLKTIFEHHVEDNNVAYAENGNRNARRQNEETNVGNGLIQSIEEYYHNVQRNPRSELTLGKTNVQFYNYNGRGHYACDCPKPRVRDAKFFREYILLATKDETGAHLNEEERISCSTMLMEIIR
nr:hypothetical protein [Tanacetum cinerariifolium]